MYTRCLFTERPAEEPSVDAPKSKKKKAPESNKAGFQLTLDKTKRKRKKEKLTPAQKRKLTLARKEERQRRYWRYWYPDPTSSEEEQARQNLEAAYRWGRVMYVRAKKQGYHKFCDGRDVINMDDVSLSSGDEMPQLARHHPLRVASVDDLTTSSPVREKTPPPPPPPPPPPTIS